MTVPSRLYLVGFMGCGKTRVGRLVADQMGHEFLDLDTMVEEQAGTTIREIFERVGESEFRRLETRCLERTAEGSDVVVATGGGVMAGASNRELLRRLGTTLWIDVPYEIIVGRMSPHGRRKRPLLDDAEASRALYTERLDTYGLADLRVTVGEGEAASQVAARIMDLVSTGR